jgi:hypothetical protein
MRCLPRNFWTDFGAIEIQFFSLVLFQDAVDCATQALEKYNIEKDVAAYIKKEFDKKYNPTWYVTGPIFARFKAIAIGLPDF